MFTALRLSCVCLATALLAPVGTSAHAARVDRNCYEDIGCPWKAEVAISALRKLSCQNLQHVRNHTYYENYYCFHTPAAKSTYGNVGCRHPVSALVPLNAYERTNIARIRRVEIEKSCP